MQNIDKISDAGWSLLTTYGPKVVGVLVALFAAWVIAGILRSWTLKALEKANVDLTLSRFISQMVCYAILVFAIVGCLGVFGIQTASFAAVIAAAGLAVGLAFQGALGNLASGVMLLVFRPFKIGNFINAAGVTGTVEEIELFTTTLKTPDNRKIIIPNGSIFGSTIENVTHHPIRRVDISVGVDYSADIDKTRETLEAAVKNIPNLLSDPEHQVFLSGLGASSVDWVVRVWTKTENYWGVHQDGVREIKNQLDQAGIGIPFPQMDVHFDTKVVESLSTGKSREAHA